MSSPASLAYFLASTNTSANAGKTNMSSTRIAFAKGPKGPGFQKPRSVSPPVAKPASAKPVVAEPPTEPDFTYPVDKPSTYKEIREWLPGRPYYNMRLEDFPDYKALGEPLRLHGPAPYRPHECGCGRWRVCANMCVCSMSCMRKPLYAWAKANPEAFQAKQREMQRWYNMAEAWRKESEAIAMKWEGISWCARTRFIELQDKESPIGCASCERWGSQYCKCECECCGRKYCPGNCCDDDERDFW